MLFTAQLIKSISRKPSEVPYGPEKFSVIYVRLRLRSVQYTRFPGSTWYIVTEAPSNVYSKHMLARPGSTDNNFKSYVHKQKRQDYSAL